MSTYLPVLPFWYSTGTVRYLPVVRTPRLPLLRSTRVRIGKVPVDIRRPEKVCHRFGIPRFKDFRFLWFEARFGNTANEEKIESREIQIRIQPHHSIETLADIVAVARCHNSYLSPCQRALRSSSSMKNRWINGIGDHHRITKGQTNLNIRPETPIRLN